uniref:Uncharacterized protein n=1 Tax=Arundo donax TaxID=35708 RepID=A0A0A9DJ13_ARUDO
MPVKLASINFCSSWSPWSNTFSVLSCSALPLASRRRGSAEKEMSPPSSRNSPMARAKIHTES